jgi:hypothetical protein
LEELAMPDLDLIKQGEQGVRDKARAICQGRSGNPAGQSRGCRDRQPRWFLLAGEGEALTRKAVKLALASDPAALRLCLPPRARRRSPAHAPHTTY